MRYLSEEHQGSMDCPLAKCGKPIVVAFYPYTDDLMYIMATRSATDKRYMEAMGITEESLTKEKG